MAAMKSLAILLATFCKLVTTVTGESSVTGKVEVTTNYGKLQGLVLDFANGNGIHIFSGIPFAAPPVGELRWKAPQKLAPWTGTYNATYYRPECYSWGSEAADGKSEDCLFLNIYKPYKGKDVGKGPFPVLFYIHGGGYTAESGSGIPGHFLAQKGVIVVTSNYRLHALGFLNTGDDVAPGNYGMLDQNAALVFVKENIAAFGGDPDAITIYGQSAGATSASLHLFSPKSKALFKKAILQSGSDQSTWAMIEPEYNPSDYSRNLAEDLGCPTANSTAMVACLRGLSAEQISDAAMDVLADIKAGALHIPWAPVVDGPDGFLPDTPANLRQRGEFAKVPLLIGITSHETGFLPIEQNVTREEFLETIRDVATLAGFNNTQQQEDAVNFEYTWWPNIHDVTENRRRLLDVASDVLFNAPVDLAMKHQSDYSTVYSYVFGYRSVNDPEPAYTSVGHTREMKYMLGYPFFDKTTLELTGKELYFNFTDEDREFSDHIMSMWTNFVKHNNPTPSAVGGVTWPKFTRSNMLSQYLDRNTQHLLNYRQHKYAFWTEYFDKIIEYKICPPPAKEEKSKLKKVIGKSKRNKSTKLRQAAERFKRSRQVAGFLNALYNEAYY